MRRLMYAIGGIASFFAINLIVPALAQDEEAVEHVQADAYLSALHARGRNSLKGIKSLGISISSSSVEVREAGVTGETILNDIAPLFKKAGIHILSKQEEMEFVRKALATKDIGQLPPTLVITINTAKRQDGLFAYSIAAGLDQSIKLARNPKSAVLRGTTWQTFGTVGIIKAEHLSQISNGVKQDIGYFLEDYKAANPKKSR